MDEGKVVDVTEEPRLACLQNIVVVLVATTHPGNIGAAARAMKTMGLSRLRLVTPSRFPAVEATARASGADDLLESAQLFDSLQAAVADCVVVAGTTARARSLTWPVSDPRSSALELVTAARASPVALVFGREHAGLSNVEVAYCQHLVRIPTAADFSSLNVAAAVQILAYELRLAALALLDGVPVQPPPQEPLATEGQLEQFYAHLQRSMAAVGFFNPEKPRRLPARLRRLFNRAALSASEVSILRGFCSAVEKAKPADPTPGSVGDFDDGIRGGG